MQDFSKMGLISAAKSTVFVEAGGSLLTSGSSAAMASKAVAQRATGISVRCTLNFIALLTVIIGKNSSLPLLLEKACLEIYPILICLTFSQRPDLADFRTESHTYCVRSA